MGHNIKVDRHNVDAKQPAQGEEDLFITVFTDASWCPETKAYGCAIWGKAGKAGSAVTHSWGGHGAPSAEAAEFAALEGAVWWVQNETNHINKVIVIQSDCINALRKLNIDDLKYRSKFVKLKHVKAHTSGRTRRTKVNDICDQLAKTEMRKYRKTAK